MTRNEQATVTIGDRIYYTGDMANSPAWGTVAQVTPQDVAIKRDGDNHVMHIWPCGIGSIYRGHCDPRFVTEKAYRAYQPNNILTQ